MNISFILEDLGYLVSSYVMISEYFPVYTITSVADPWHFSVYPDPDLDPHIHASDQSDPAIFLIDLQNANNKQIF
jgi:hypothetical protein